MSDVPEGHIRITFDGPATEGGKMPLREFCESMMALDNLVRAVSREQNPDGPEVRLMFTGGHLGAGMAVEEQP